MPPAAEPFGLAPVGAEAGWITPGAGGYLAYRGTDPDNIDWDDPVGIGQAGDLDLYARGAGHVPDAVYFYGVRAVSDAGVQETNTSRICRVTVDGLGALGGGRPVGLRVAKARPAAAGTVRISFVYDAPAVGHYGEASAVQVAEVSGGVPDWGSPVDTFTIDGSGRRDDVELSSSWSHGERVELAIRAVTSGGVSGPHTLLVVAADTAGPDPVEYITASQA